MTAPENPKSEIRDPKEIRRATVEHADRGHLQRVQVIGAPTPHPGPLPVEGRGGRAGRLWTDPGQSRVGAAGMETRCQNAAVRLRRFRSPRRDSLSPQRGEGWGEGCEIPQVRASTEFCNRHSRFGSRISSSIQPDGSPLAGLCRETAPDLNVGAALLLSLSLYLAMPALGAEADRAVSGSETNPLDYTIIVTGEELLRGAYPDGHTCFITRTLHLLGCHCVGSMTVDDEAEDLKQALRFANGRVRLILVTGGLGPTVNDLTRDALAQFTGIPLREHPDVLADIEAKTRTALETGEILSVRKEEEVPDVELATEEMFS